jgi:hypothetical protein
MCTNLFQDSRLFEIIQRIDRDSEIKAGSQPCDRCRGKLDRAYFSRKPRGVAEGFERAFIVRPSFCCRVDGCRKRLTPPQLRFLGRKVFISVIVLLAAAMTQGPSPKRLCQIQRELGIAPQTLRRWLTFWREVFAVSNSWIYVRGNFIPPVDESQLPGSLLQRLAAFHPNPKQAIVTLLTITIQ